MKTLGRWDSPMPRVEETPVQPGLPATDTGARAALPATNEPAAGENTTGIADQSSCWKTRAALSWKTRSLWDWLDANAQTVPSDWFGIESGGGTSGHERP